MKGKMRRALMGVAVFWSFSAACWAQGDGGQAGAFLRYGIGGRALGMGRAFVAVANDASGVYWNPAGMVGARRPEITSMYTNLYYDSQFAHFGVVIPRPGPNIKDKVARFLVGPGAAFGFGWVGLSTTGYEQTTDTGVFLGDFGIQEMAFLMAWAREEVGTWGIFRYGVSFKFVNQNFSGLQRSPSMEFQETTRNWSGGMDIGFTFQPIHAPIFRLFSLRYLLPLHLGLVVQNVIQPGWGEKRYSENVFPRVVRWGFSYRWVLKDWIPESWSSLRRWVGNSHILTAFDRELCRNTKTGNYFGLEGFFPLSKSGLAFFPRVGFNNSLERTSLGMGLALPFTRSAIVRIDYAYGTHTFLPEDNRFFLTVQMGREKGAEYFTSESQKKEFGREEVRRNLLRVLSEYPNDFVGDAAKELATMEDSVRARRYFDLTGGLDRANWLFQEAKAFLKQGRIEKARKKASEANEEYAPIFAQPEHALSDVQMLDYGESLVIAGRIEEAMVVLEEVSTPSLRGYYLLGKCQKSREDWDGAIEMFRNAVKRYEEEQDLNSMVCLAFLELGESLLRKEQYESAITTLEILIKNYSKRLDPNYPRYPGFDDDYVVDDAQFLMGLSYLLLKQPAEGVTSMMQTSRFYPDLEYGRITDARANTLIEVLDTANWDRLEILTKTYLEQYYQNHKWP